MVNEVAVVSTVYPGMLPFLGNFLDSLEQQEFQEFDLLLANDGVENLGSRVGQRSFPWSSFEPGGSISDIRRALLKAALTKGYRKIVLADSDDTFADNRIGLMCRMLDSDSLVVNDLDLCDAGGRVSDQRYFSRRLDDGDLLDRDSLLHGNLMGLSNTAVAAEVLIGSPALQAGDCIAFDWFLWSSILLAGVKGKFTSETSTLYRIYGENTAGLPQYITEPFVRKGVQVKRQHYALMAGLDDGFQGLADEFEWTSRQMQSRAWLNDYLDALRANEIENNLWWEKIRTPSEVGLA